MALKLYPRHRKERKSGHPEDARTGQFEGGATRLLLQKVNHRPAVTVGQRIKCSVEF